jgi:chlorite dismutase
MSQSHSSLPPILPSEGLHVVHLFFRVERVAWEFLDGEERRERCDKLARVVAEIQALPRTQLLPFSMVSPKSDMGFMLLTPDLQDADRCSKRLADALGAGVLTPVFSWLSLTERSEYTTTEAEYTQTLKEEGVEAGTPEFEEKMTAFHYRIAKYLKYRLEPDLPSHAEWPVVCFYPMSKRRNVEQNWYAETFEHRNQLMAGHAKVGRTYAGRVLQLITGSTGLDDMEWGVTLFAKTTSEIKSIVYEMRFDEVSSRYAEFGEFVIGIRMDVPSLCERLDLL